MAIVANMVQASSNINKITLSVWRRRQVGIRCQGMSHQCPQLFDMIGESQEFTLEQKDPQTLHEIVLDHPIHAKKGDYFGFYSGDVHLLYGIRNNVGSDWNKHSAVYNRGHLVGRKQTFMTTCVTYWVSGSFGDGAIQGDQWEAPKTLYVKLMHVPP